MSGDELVNFRALLLANEQRNAYGLRYNDYERYRKHCANRTHRLRSSLKMTHGKGREFKKLPPLKPDTIKDGHLQLLLFEAERAWVYSQELSLQSTKLDSNPKAGAPVKGHDNTLSALRRHATSRLRRAVHYSTEFLSHCQALYALGRLSASSLVEATVYTLLVSGRLFRHRYEYEDALTQLSVARSLLDALADAAPTSRAQALAIAFADEVGPEIRHCAHELRMQNAYDVDEIVKIVAPENREKLVEGCDTLLTKLTVEGKSETKGRERLEEILWENESVPVRNPELVDVLLRMQEAQRRLKDNEKEEKIQGDVKAAKGARSKRGGVAAYDAILSALSDAEDVARRLTEVQQLSGNSSTPSAGTRDIQFVYAYIVYQLLSYRIRRDLLLIATLLHQSQAYHHPQPSGAKPNPRKEKERVDARLFPAVVKLLDTVVQSLEQMRALTIVDESPNLASAVEARLAFTKARRCRYLARCYAPIKRYAEALNLTQHAQLHLREARSIFSILGGADPIASDTPPFYSLTNVDIDSLEAEVNVDSLDYKHAWFTYNGGALHAESAKTYKKPIFFDIALNYVQLDMDRLQERSGKKPVQQKIEPTRAPQIQAPVPEKKITSRAEEIERAPTPEPSAAAKGGLSSLLGGWWGRK